MSVKINDRLKSVASLVEDNSKVIDIGCDHALLSIYLVENKKIDRVIASDNKQGPLEGAKENVKKYKVSDKVSVKLGDGIEPLEDDIDTIVISGMGGMNIVGILKYKPWLLKSIKSIILSPNTDTDFVRREICKLGYYIDDELLVKDRFIYPVIRFKKGKKHYKKIEYILGPILLEKKDKIFIEYLNYIKETKKNILEILPKKYILKRIILKKELKEINKLI